MMSDIDAKEMAELFPFAARRVVKCETVLGKSAPRSISVEEILAVVKGNRPMGTVNDGFLDGTPAWVFCTAEGGVVSSYTMSSEMKVAEARSLRDAEMG
ncbi:MAG: hypothetical protein HHJ17_00050 [Rhodoferax sp.]|uniref:hypothetical protein n=1 Tax=Rhodoferax sp. TaxID=50421 RepID=UPI0017FF7D2A|nr:hypothetical protein [Rhodoferax sp.]NMM11920.1 hypothetical protein [Rhodoferax sp.]